MIRTKIYIPIAVTLTIILFAVIAYRLFQNKNEAIVMEHSLTNINEAVYKINEPDEKFKLPRSLVEISGITYIGDRQFACVQDEKGKIYIYDTNFDEITNTIRFHKKGDYEDIAAIGQNLYVLRSDGTIFEIIDYNADEPKVHEYDTPLKSKNDTEGLCYDKKKDELLIICKSRATIDKESKDEANRTVYSFDLKQKNLSENPVYSISKEAISEIAKKNDIRDENEESFEDITKGDFSFRPSGISVHPLTDKIYIIASVGKLMVIIDRNSNVCGLYKLSKKTFKQPEGICFAPNGDMYISNEGRKGKGNILKFNMQK